MTNHEKDCMFNSAVEDGVLERKGDMWVIMQDDGTYWSIRRCPWCGTVLD